ncbi:hypothetical protein CFOLD11_40830 [Clostridium folliculivorans]|uniref:Uncharacterized protein n=1 Tax=Clostridium folliculivorans TaxID=2886038 RepID=A0A9W6DCQ6_9CLOT|nr:hypothetical protein [Clostridium folliculivorans]GKU27256.1 hypothetical protein CFOLD11_40830 [Clostridium folliculivorans]
MDIPNYVLKINEAVLVPKNDNPAQGYIKNVVLIIVAILLIGSVVFHDNLFGEISWGTRALLIVIGIASLFSGGSHRVPSPIELRFYDDYLIVYREKRYYNRKVTRKEFDKFFYKDIHKLEHRTVTQRINIYGVVEGIWYNYNKDGSLPDNPTYHKTTDSISYFYTSHALDVDFVAEIENHSPIKVIVEEN